jgi:hypothetical protein
MTTENRKLKMRAHRLRWQKKNRARCSAAAAEWQRRQDPNKRREQRQEHRFRWRAGHNSELTGLSILVPHDERRPPLKYITTDGAIHVEDYRSAEQLIADFLEAEAARKRPK